MKIFNTTGPCIPGKHYMVDLSSRLNQIKAMVDDGQYFIINRARQYGKTTTLFALKKFLKDSYVVLSLDFQGISSGGFRTEESFVKAFCRMLLTRSTDSIPDCIASRLRSYYDAILRMIRLRYSLVPYIYSMAAAQTRQDYTMARMLAFDFADDPQVLDLKDEYMFGRFLVCPVVQPLSETAVRRVYLPAGETWMDFWTGQRHQGGQWLSVPVTIAQLPLYVRAGSIITTTEVAQYTDAQVGLPLTVNVYPGRDAHFELYEDEGDNYNFEQGAFSVIPLDWDEARQTLTVGPREGSYPGMPSVRKLIVKTPTGQKTITYKGRPQRVRFH